MAKYRHPNTINEELDEINTAIMEYEEFLTDKSRDPLPIKTNLKKLESKRKQLQNELLDANDHYNVDTFDILIKKGTSGESPSIKDVAEISLSIQNLVSSLGLAYKGPVNRGSQIPIDIINATTLGISRAETGSLRLFIKTNPLKTDSQKRFVTLTRTAIDNLISLISCGKDKDLIKIQAERLGTQSIDRYKNLLKTISDKEVDLFLFDEDKPRETSTQSLTKDFAGSVYSVIVETQPAIKERIQIEGILGVINTFYHTFTLKDSNKKQITVFFNEVFTESVKKRLEKSVTVEIEITKEYHELEDKTDEKRDLIRFVN